MEELHGAVQYIYQTHGLLRNINLPHAAKSKDNAFLQDIKKNQQGCRYFTA